MAKAYTLGEIAARLQGTVSPGNSGMKISGIGSIRDATAGEIAFLGHRRYLPDVKRTKAAAILVSDDLWSKDLGLPTLRVANAYYAFSQVIALYHEPHLPARGIHPHSVIGNAAIGKELYVGPFVTIEDGAVLGDRVTLYSGVYVGAGVRIGDDSILYPHVILREGVQIGRRVIVHGGTVIGSDGFGFVLHEGRHHKIPQAGGVIIEDDVEIGANVTIDRATLGNTVIRRGTKLDNLVQVGHNVTIGEHGLVVAQSGISGSCDLGNYVVLAGQSGLTGHLRVGDGVQVAARGVVTKDVPAGQTVSGFPAGPHREWLKIQALIQQLPAMKEKVSKLERQLASMQEKWERDTLETEDGPDA